MIHPAVGSPTTFSELERAVTLGEVFRIRQRMLVGHENRRQLERALSERRARRHARVPSRQHVEVAAAREHIDRVDVDEAAVVVAYVDDHALLRLIVGVEIEVQLREGTGRHVEHVHVTQLAAAGFAT
jgi:hypothetical protein